MMVLSGASDVTGVPNTSASLISHLIDHPYPGMPKTPSNNSARPALRRNQVFHNLLYNLLY